MALTALGGCLWGPPKCAGPLCLAGVALGDIEVPFAWQAGVARGDIDEFSVWQAWRLVTSMLILCVRRGAE